jgi:hypothetical protein
MKCTAHNRAGKRCGNFVVEGATVCRMHGGAAPQVKRAAHARAARLEAHAAAERMVARAGVDVDPLEHLLDSLYRATTLMNMWGLMASAIDAAAEDEAAASGALRGELGYFEADDDSHDELGVISRDRMLALNAKGEATIHPYVEEYQRAVERRAKLAKLCIDAGVAERQVQLAEQQGQLMAQAIRGILTDLGVADHPAAPGVVRRHLTLITAA